MKKLSALVSSALVAVLVMTAPLALAADTRASRPDGPPPASATPERAQLDGADIVNTLHWGHCTEAWLFTNNSNGCYCYFVAQAGTIGYIFANTQLWCLEWKLATLHNHWLGVHWDNSGNIDYIRDLNY
jgi:hypothetical protein